MLLAFGEIAIAQQLQIVGQVLYFVLVFAVVVALTIVVTRGVAGSRFRRGHACNLQVVESVAVGQQVYLQLVRVGDKYVVIGVTRDSVSFLWEIAGEEVKLPHNDNVIGDSIVVQRFEKYLKALRKDNTSNSYHSTSVSCDAKKTS